MADRTKSKQDKLDQLGGGSKEEMYRVRRLLKKRIWFMLLQEAGRDTCFRCGLPLSEDDFSVDHKEPWLHSENPLELFLNLNNIAFSHQKCNYRCARNRLTPTSPTGFRGVRLRKSGKYQAIVRMSLGGNKRKRVCSGQYKTAKEAAEAYDKKVVELFGLNAVTNKSLGLL